LILQVTSRSSGVPLPPRIDIILEAKFSHPKIQSGGVLLRPGKTAIHNVSPAATEAFSDALTAEVRSLIDTELLGRSFTCFCLGCASATEPEPAVPAGASTAPSRPRHLTPFKTKRPRLRGATPFKILHLISLARDDRTGPPGIPALRQALRCAPSRSAQ